MATVPDANKGVASGPPGGGARTTADDPRATLSTRSGSVLTGRSAGDAERIPASAWITLGILMMLYISYFLDKVIFSLLANLIATSLGFTDGQLGVLQGFAFSIPYSLGVLAAGWAADRYSRPRILFLGALVWSVGAMASGLTTTFDSMLIARGILGLGEATLLTCALSILASVFPRERVAGAIGIFYAGASIGGVTALLFGGQVVQALVAARTAPWPVLGVLQPWQAAFLLTGAPGVALAFLTFAIRLNERGRAKIDERDRQDLQTFGGYVRENTTFLLTYSLAFCAATACAMTTITWAPPYFGRAFGWDHRMVGMVAAAGLGSGIFGNILWGSLADRLRRRGYKDAAYRVFIVAFLIATPIGILAFLTPSTILCVIGFVGSALVFTSIGSLMSGLQLAAPEHLRGRLNGANLLMTGVFGLGLGPTLAGWLAEYVFGGRAFLGPAIATSIALSGFATAALLFFGRPAFLRALNAQDRQRGIS